MVLPAVSIVRTDSVPVPDSVTPEAVKVPDPAVASTQVDPSALTWIFSPEPSEPVKVPLTVCDATLVTKSPAVPVSELSAVTVATADGAEVSIVTDSAAEATLVLPAASVALAVMLCVPPPKVELVIDQLPEPSAVAVPTC